MKVLKKIQRKYKSKKSFRRISNNTRKLRKKISNRSKKSFRKISNNLKKSIRKISKRSQRGGTTTSVGSNQTIPSNNPTPTPTTTLADTVSPTCNTGNDMSMFQASFFEPPIVNQIGANNHQYLNDHVYVYKN